jgi:hypothetical protein
VGAYDSLVIADLIRNLGLSGVEEFFPKTAGNSLIGSI